MNVRGLSILLVAVLSGGLCSGEEEAPMPWEIRFQGQLGGGYFMYKERLSSAGADSDFDTGSFAIQVSAEGNFSGLSPHLRLMTHISGGTEEFDAPGLDQESSLSVSTVLLDVGGGYRLELGDVVTLVPSLSYTFDYLGFNRSEFEINGTDVLVSDLDGKILDDVGETIVGHGVSPAVGLELALSSVVELHLHAVGTWLPEVLVDNDIGGALTSDGYLIRGTAAVNVRLLRYIAIRGSVQVAYQRLENSRFETRTGSMASATVIYPDSNTLWIVIGFGVEARF